jgi:predicted aldo/keto reductase-like oxidoreductase
MYVHLKNKQSFIITISPIKGGSVLQTLPSFVNRTMQPLKTQNLTFVWNVL